MLVVPTYGFEMYSVLLATEIICISGFMECDWKQKPLRLQVNVSFIFFTEKFFYAKFLKKLSQKMD